jgi:hypothetical protein
MDEIGKTQDGKGGRHGRIVTSKSEPRFLPGYSAKKGKQHLALLGDKGNESPDQSGFSLGFHDLRVKRLPCPQTQTYPAKSRVLLFAAS